MNDLQHRNNIGLPRSAVEMAEARALLRPWHLAGYRLILLSSTAKMPIEKGWQEIDYARRVRPWLERGGNIGILLGEDDLVLVREVVIDAAGRTAGGGDDLGDGRRPDAVAANQCGRGGDDVIAAAGRHSRNSLPRHAGTTTLGRN